MPQTPTLPRPTIEAFDRHVLGLGLRFEGIVVGDSALRLMGITQRPTRDFDILLPDETRIESVGETRGDSSTFARCPST